LDNLENFLDNLRRQAEGGLIQEKNFRARHPKRVRSASICCSPPERVPAFCHNRSLIRGKSSKTFSFVRGDLRFVLAQKSAEREIFFHRQGWQKSRGLPVISAIPLAKSSSGRLPTMDLALVKNIAGGRAQKSRNCLERGALAGAVRTHQGNYFPASTEKLISFSA